MNAVASPGVGAGRPARTSRRLLIVAVVLMLAACDAVAPSSSGGREPASEDVTVAADGLALEGTLRLPAGDPPFPGVVIAHGSGPHSREGLVQGQLGLTLPRQVAVYGELAEGLQDRGYAVLTWDKRSCGPFNDCADNDYPTPPDDLTFDTFTRDVAAVLDHLEEHDGVGDLVLVGHSKGGTIAAQLAAERDDLDAVVLLASPAVPIDEVLAAQVETLEELVLAAGQHGAAVDQAVAETAAVADEVAAIAAGEHEGPDVGGASRAFWASWVEASRAAPEHVRSAEVPVLALGGEHDWNVPPPHVRAWQSSLPEGGTVEVLPGITHALTRLGTDDPAALTPQDVGTSVDRSVVEEIDTWLDTVLAD